MLKAIQRLFAPPRQPAPGRQRLTAQDRPAVLYAIGDVHGCARELDMLMQMIQADAATIDSEKWLVMLGDYVDRGPQSATVLDWLTSPAPQPFRRIALAGNHERMMLDFLDAPTSSSAWLGFGGLETLRSYGITADVQAMSQRLLASALASHVPEDHVEFMRNLPTSLQVPGYLFVHAGIRPGVPLEQQTDEDLMWIRQDFLEAELDTDFTVVHGHTPAEVPVAAGRRIGIDTGAFASGRLTALRITADDAAPSYFHT